MAEQSLLQKARTALRITTSAYDDEIMTLLDAAYLDLGVAGVVVPDPEGALVEVAALTYVRMRFGSPDDYERLKSAYDEQKAQLATCTGYTDWGGADV